MRFALVAAARRLAGRREAQRQAYINQQLQALAPLDRLRLRARLAGGRSRVAGVKKERAQPHPTLPNEPNSTLPVLLEPMEPGHVPLPRAAIITGLPVHALNREARARRVPGAYLVGSVLHFDLLAMMNWIEGFRTGRRPERGEIDHNAAMGLSVSDVARRLRVDESTVRKMVRRGELQAFKVRRAVRIWGESLDAYTRRTAIQAEHEAVAARRLATRTRSNEHEAAVRDWEARRRRTAL